MRKKTFPDRLLRPVPAAVLPLLLAGCAGLQAPAAPTIDAPEGWTAPVTAGTAPVESAEAWWTGFGDSGLDLLVTEVLERNRNLEAAAARVDRAAALARIAGADLEPSVSVALDASRRRQNFLGFPIPGGDSRALSTTTTTFGTSLNLSWEADLWGRLRARRDAARADAEAAAADYAAARLSLAGQTAKAWFALVEAGRQVDLAREVLDSRTLTRRQIERRFRSGLRSGVDLRLAIANEAAARSSLEGRLRLADAARRQLELLLSGYPAGAERPAAESAELPPPPEALPAGLPAELVARRPDLVAFDRRLAAAGLGVVQAKASLYPQLRLTGSAGRLSQEVEDLLEDDFSVWSLASGLLQPIFQGGRLRAGVALSEAAYRELAASYEQAVLSAFAEVELALAAERYLTRQAEALTTAAQQAEAAQRQAEQRYAAGLGPYLVVLEAQREAAASRSRLLQRQREILDARIDLHLALGGGWSEPPRLATALPASAPSPGDSE